MCEVTKKHCFLRCFARLDDHNLFVGERKKTWFLRGFWFREGPGKEKLASSRSFNRDGLTYSQHSLNIGPKMGQHRAKRANIGPDSRANIGQRRANIEPT